jgi:hypothetical protein
LVLGQDLCLLLQAGGEGALGQAQGSGQSDLLHQVEVHVQAGAGLAEGALGNDFAPAGGQVADLLEHLGGQLAARHGVSCLVLAEMARLEVLLPL